MGVTIVPPGYRDDVHCHGEIPADRRVFQDGVGWHTTTYCMRTDVVALCQLPGTTAVRLYCPDHRHQFDDLVAALDRAFLRGMEDQF